MIDASKGFIKDGNKNRLRAQDIHRIVDTFTRQVEVPRYSRMVPLFEIGDPKNDFNLNLPATSTAPSRRTSRTSMATCAAASPSATSMRSPAYWEVLPSVRPLLFKSANHPGYFHLTVVRGRRPKLPSSATRSSPCFNATVTALFAKWKATHRPSLNVINPAIAPKALIETPVRGRCWETFRQRPAARRPTTCTST